MTDLPLPAEREKLRAMWMDALDAAYREDEGEAYEFFAAALAQLFKPGEDDARN